MKSTLSFFSSIVICLVITSCSKDDHHNVDFSEVIKRWTVRVSSNMTNPVNAAHADSGTLTVELHANNSLSYDFLDSNLASGDLITAANIRSGDPVTNGPVVLDLNPRISSGYLSGTLLSVRQSLVDSLLNSNNNLYFNVESKQVPAGIARGQINLTVVATFNIALKGQNEVPPVTTTTTGNAYLRLTSDSVLYSKVTVANVEANDIMNAAHIHKAAVGVNGPIIVPLVASPAEFGVSRKTTVAQATYNSLLNDQLYVNAHSVLYPAGKIRGQIR